MTHNRHYIHMGFTIVELMIVIVIMGVIAAMGYPGMQRQIAEQRLKESVSMTENLLKQARSDALISRSEVKSVITTATATSAASLTLTQSINGVNNTQPHVFNPNIVIEPVDSMPTTIRFTPEKRVYQGDAGRTALSVSSAAGYTFCYTGVSSDRYLLTVDAMTNVRVAKSGVCL